MVLFKKYLEQKDALHAGKKHREREDGNGINIKRMVNHFLNAKAAASRDANEITWRSWQDYKDACDLLVSHFGANRLVSDLGPDDFAALRKKLAKKWGPTTLGNVINRMRVAFKFAFGDDLIERQVRFGASFKRPSKKTLRIAKAQKGAKLFTAEQIRKALEAVNVHVKAMVLLSVNCGFGNADCGTLPMQSLDLHPTPLCSLPHFTQAGIQVFQLILGFSPTKCRIVSPSCSGSRLYWSST